PRTPERSDDGLCYHVQPIFDRLKDHTQNIHFDEAWFAYAGFNGFYKGFFAMDIKKTEGGPTVFATQSTHKVLAAFSQASMIHIKVHSDGKLRFDHAHFNEAFMMHTSTSPQYGIIASLDVATGMMRSYEGHVQLDEAIKSAIRFRYKVNETFANANSWFFKVWQPEKTQLRKERDFNTMLQEVETTTTTSFPSILRPEDWLLKPGDPWHGFEIESNECILLDPTKVTILTPGIGEDEKLHIPATIVTKYMRDKDKDKGKGIVVEKTGLYSFLMLYTIGATRDKVDETIEVMRSFREEYNAKDSKLQALCADMHKFLKRTFLDDDQGTKSPLMNRIYERDLIQDKLPWEAYEALVRGLVKEVAIDSLTPAHVIAVQLTPYPPGIPLMMPGEKFTEDIIQYLKYLRDFDAKYPDYQTEIHGLIIKEGGRRFVLCLDHLDEG
ncbi:MAG: lysine decarboxylase, partial [Oscillochloris sp.]|nr:lysine decarboxylase [Oscillochloris sp.]